MSGGPIKRLFDALKTRWDALEYQAPLVYGYRQSFRTDLDPVAEHGGRVVMHAGEPGERGNAGELSPVVLQAFETGRAVATDWAAFTVYCHGYDRDEPNEEINQDDVADCLKEQFLGVLSDVIPGMGHYWRLISQTWIRSPQERRYGETIEMVLAVAKSIRAAPAHTSIKTGIPVASVIVQAPAAPIEVIKQEI